MPDWEELVGRRLGRMKLAPEEQREVVAEVAAHLEDCYDELAAAGSPDPEGYTLAQVPDWKALGRRIQRSKEGAMNQTIRIVLCGLLTGTVAVLFALTALRFAGAEVHSMLEAARQSSTLPNWTGGAFHLPAGVFVLWLYTAIRPKYGPGTKTAVLAGLTLWAIATLTLGHWSSMGIVPLNFLLAATTVGLPAWVLGVVAGAWFYEATERKPFQALKAA
jgi:hypothetical protein